MNAVALAQENPERQVVFFAVGFETTAPANAMAAYRAHELDLKNFSLLVSHVLVPPAIEAILSSPGNTVQAFLAAGHVCTVMGGSEYDTLCRKYHVPIVITGFEPLDILHGIYMCIKQLEENRTELENQYSRVVLSEGNRKAQEIMHKVFEITNRNWRGLGTITSSGLKLTGEFERFDAERRFGATSAAVPETGDCQSAQVLLGRIKPTDCPSFGTKCTPEHPLGATMVSSEGACAAYYRYRKFKPAVQRFGKGNS
jgi:hydrogenase expression/formation protein HypD